MEEKRKISGIELPREDWEKTPESVKAAFTSLSERLATQLPLISLVSQHLYSTTETVRTRSARRLGCGSH